jgi:hypothetical protein
LGRVSQNNALKLIEGSIQGDEVCAVPKPAKSYEWPSGTCWHVFGMVRGRRHRRRF